MTMPTSTGSTFKAPQPEPIRENPEQPRPPVVDLLREWQRQDPEAWQAGAPRRRQWRAWR
jgi:hypothetical protein